MRPAVRPLIALFAAAAFAAPVLAETVAAPKPVESGRPRNQVEDVIVERGPLPKVDATFPAQGAEIAPGVLVLRVSFDQPMAADGWSYAPDPATKFPDCGKAPRRLEDQKSFVIICRVLPGETYGLWFNHEGAMNFTSPGRRPATPYRLSFTTSKAPPVVTLQAALKRDAALPPGSDPSEPEGVRERAPSR